MGSLAEVTYTLSFAKKRGWAKSYDWDSLEIMRENASRMLWLLYKSVRQVGILDRDLGFSKLS